MTLPAPSTLPDVDLNVWTGVVSERKYKEVYTVGITNIFRTYGVGAKFTELLRSVKSRKDSLVDTEPNIYAERLIKFAGEAIVSKPHHKKSKRKKAKEKGK